MIDNSSMFDVESGALFCVIKHGSVAELVDAHDSKSCIVRCVGSIPTFGTKREQFAPFFISAPPVQTHLYCLN